jgi:hypothetical protein
MKVKALLICALFLASMFLVVITPVSAEIPVDEYNITKYDPMDDVMRARTGGDFKFTAHDNVEIKIISSAYDGSNPLIPMIDLTMTVKGQIKNSDDYKYAFTVVVDNSREYIFAAYQNGQAVGFQMESDDLLIGVSASGENTNTLTISFPQSEIGPVNSEFDIFGAAVFSVEDSERFLDLAPDKLILVTEPSHLSTVSGSITVKGVIRQYESGSPSGTVKIQIDNGVLEDVTGFDPWSYSLSTTSLTDGQHTIYVEIEGTEFTDEITINVDQGTGSYDSFDQEPITHVGDWYDYLTVGNPKISGINLPVSSEMSVRVTDLTTVDGTEVYEVKTHTEGEQDLGYISYSNTMDRTSWKKSDGFGTIKENTVSTVEVSFRPDTTVNTTTTYSPPLEIHNDFSVEVGFDNNWILHTTASAESETTVSGGETTTNSYTESSTITGECLYYLNSYSVHGNSFTDIYVIQSYYENPGISIVEFYSPDLGIPVQIDTYDASRNLMFSLGLDDYFQVPFSVIIDSITFDPAKPKADTDNDIVITVKNIGVEDASNVKVTIKDGDREVGQETISSIPIGQSADQSFKWNPKGEGSHSIKVTLEYQNTVLDEETRSVEVDPAPTDGPTDIFFILILIIIIVVVLVLVAVPKRKLPRLKANRLRQQLRLLVGL